MAELRLTDGRTLAYEQWGDTSGPLVFRLHGMPGSRLTRHPDPALWNSLGAHVVTFDRPGFGDSTRSPDRRVADVCKDVAALADVLDVGQFFVMGISGGGPHALACAALLPDRVIACAPVCSAAHHTPQEEDELIPVNREGYHRYHDGGWQAIAEFLRPIREQLLDDTATVLQRLFAVAPAADQTWLADRAFQTAFTESTQLALRDGVEGWADETVAVLDDDWGFDASRARGAVHFWHAELDNATRLTALRRLATSVPNARLTLWPNEGHLGSLTHEAEIIEDLLAMGHEAGSYTKSDRRPSHDRSGFGF